jgi:hypothetical protein
MVMSTASANAADPTPAPSSPAALNQIQPASVDGNLLRAVAGTQAKLPLTLVTGDKVQIGVTADGKPVVHEIEPAARPGHESVLFQTITRNGQLYVVPDDVLPLLRADLLDWELFNLAKLADWAAKGTTGEVPVIAAYSEKISARTAPTAAGTKAKSVLKSINARSMTIKGNGQWWREVREKTVEFYAALLARHNRIEVLRELGTGEHAAAALRLRGEAAPTEALSGPHHHADRP